MHEKLIEDWLTNVNELGYQIPFCEVLMAEGFSIIHVSTHGRNEHGKDIVARAPDGHLETFQLKGGDILLTEWRKIRGEIEELVQLPVRLPGVDESEPHVPFLVTNGEIRGDALEDIKRYVNIWIDQGYPELQICSRRMLLARFLDVHGTFLPGALRDFKLFVELYAGDFHDALPKKKMASLLEVLADDSARQEKVKQVRRGLAALAVVASYVVEQYERAENHLAAAEGWTMIAAAIMRVAELLDLGEEIYSPSLLLLYSALSRSLEKVATEALESSSFSASRHGFVDSHIYGVRVCLTLGWLSAWALDRKWRREMPVDVSRMASVIAREYPGHRLAGEVDWPYIMCLALYLDREWMQSDAENIVIRYANTTIAVNQGQRPRGAPSPYWSHRKVLKAANDMLPPYANEYFGGAAFSLHQALDMLVRRMRRQALRVMWRRASYVKFCDFVPDHLADYFLWRCKFGNLRVVAPGNPTSWSSWRTESRALDARLVPRLLVKHPEWVLPFLLTYPHRANRSMCALAEAVTNSYVRLEGA